MPRIESKIGTSPFHISKVYAYIADFRNFREIAQSKLEQFEASEDKCSFTIPSLGKGELSMLEKESLKMVKMEGRGISNSRFILWIQTNEAPDEGTHIKITMEPKLNPMLMALAKSHLQSFVDMLVEQIENYRFDNETPQ